MYNNCIFHYINGLSNVKIFLAVFLCFSEGVVCNMIIIFGGLYHQNNIKRVVTNRSISETPLSVSDWLV